MSGSLGIKATVAALIGGVLLFVISMIIIRLYENSISKNANLKPVIARKF